MGVKDNFSQAFKEILAKAVQEEEEKEETVPVSETVSAPSEPEPDNSFAMPEPKPQPQAPAPNTMPQNTVVQNRAAENKVNVTAKPEIKNNRPENFNPVQRGVEMELSNMIDLNAAETTTISKGTSIVGEIKSDSNVEMMGSMQGNIETTGNVRISGKVAGNIKGDNIELVSCAIQGDILAKSSVKMDSGSITVGNITAGTVDMDGKLKGNVQVESTATIHKNALLVGNLVSTTVSVHEGARIHGEVKITLDQEAEKVFEQSLPL